MAMERVGGGQQKGATTISNLSTSIFGFCDPLGNIRRECKAWILDRPLTHNDCVPPGDCFQAIDKEEAALPKYMLAGCMTLGQQQPPSASP